MAGHGLPRLNDGLLNPPKTLSAIRGPGFVGRDQIVAASNAPRTWLPKGGSALVAVFDDEAAGLGEVVLRGLPGVGIGVVEEAGAVEGGCRPVSTSFRKKTP